MYKHTSLKTITLQDIIDIELTAAVAIARCVNREKYILDENV